MAGGSVHLSCAYEVAWALVRLRSRFLLTKTALTHTLNMSLFRTEIAHKQHVLDRYFNPQQ